MANINDIVSLVKIDIGRSDSSKDLQFKKWAIQGWKQIGMFNVAPFFKSVKLKVTNRKAELPIDYQEYVKIGLCVGGKIMNYTLNEKICLLSDEVCCVDYQEDFVNTDLVLFNEKDNFPYRLGYIPYNEEQVFNGVYGHGNTIYRGGYRINEETRQIVFDFDIDEIVIEYRGGEDNAYIPDYCVQALVEYVHLQRCKYTNNPSERAMLQVHKKLWIQQVRIANSKRNGLTAYEILDIFRNSWKQTLKV